jgi:hypothetical protein
LNILEKKKKEKRRKKRKSGRKEGRRLGYATALSGKRLGNAQEGKGRTPRGMAFPILHIHNHGKGLIQNFIMAATQLFFLRKL